MAQQCISASDQYFTFPALNVSVPPVTLSLWFKVSSIVVGKHTTLFAWRGTINTEFHLANSSSNWQLRYSVAGGTQWNIATGLNVSVGIWQHACVAITSSQARLYLDGANYTANVSNATANVNDMGYLGKDPIGDGGHVAFNGSIAEAAIWDVALADAECRALAKRLSPLQLSNRLPNLLMYRDLIRETTRGVGPALTAINAPTVAPHPPLAYPQAHARLKFSPAHFLAPFRPSIATAQASPVMQGGTELAGAAAGATSPFGEVSS